MFFVSINETEREHSNSLRNIFVFVNEVFKIKLMQNFRYGIVQISV